MAYMNQERKSIIAAALKKVVPTGWKYTLAVRHHSTIVMTITEAPVDLIAEINEAEKNERHFRPVVGRTALNPYHYERAFGPSLKTMRAIFEALNKGNHDNSDLMTDYFDVGWYVDVNIGRRERDFVCNDARAAITAACVARGLSADRLIVSVVR